MGANICTTTLLPAQKVKEGHVYSFEPIPINFTNIERLIRFSHKKNNQGERVYSPKTTAHKFQ